MEYMAHEATAVFVAAWSAAALWSLVCLASGRVAWERWLAVAASPPAIVVACATLAAFVYHAWTWFRIMPLTLPAIEIGGHRVQAGAIVLGGLLLATATNVGLAAILLEAMR